MRRVPRLRACIVTGLGALGAGIALESARAGALSPPAGAPAPTMKTLQEVEPRRPLANNPDGVTPIVITQPGSYYLTENIVGLTGEHAIIIKVSDVTLDLRGFVVEGGAGASLDGIRSLMNLSNITVRNGVVRDCTGEGVNLDEGMSCMVEDVHVRACLGGGIEVAWGASVRGCVVRECGFFGYFVAQGSAVIHCSASTNLGDGFRSQGAATFQNCGAFENRDDGFGPGKGSTLSACTASYNTEDGFDTDAHCSLQNCAATENTLAGFESGLGCTYLDCSASENGMWGFSVGNALIRGCIARDNGTANGDLFMTTVFESVIP